MDWLCNILGSTAVITVLSGVLIFVVGQIFIEFVMRPVQKYKELKADAAFCLRFYRSKFRNCTVDEAAQRSAKEMAAKFIAYAQEKPWFLFATRKTMLLECCEKFTVLSHCVARDNENFEKARDCEEKIVKNLNLFWSS